MDEVGDSIESLVVKYLVAHAQCEGCGSRFEPDDVRIHEHRGSVWLASLTCSRCGLRGLVIAALRGSGNDAENEAGESATEAGATQSPPTAITDDEVLDFHRHLDRFRGDIQHLFGKT